MHENISTTLSGQQFLGDDQTGLYSLQNQPSQVQGKLCSKGFQLFLDYQESVRKARKQIQQHKPISKQLLEQQQTLQQAINNLIKEEQALMQIQVEESALHIEIDNLELQRQQLYDRLHLINLEYSQKYQQYSSIIQNQREEIQDQLESLESSIYFLQGQISKLNQECKHQLEEKQLRQASIRQYNLKREKLTIKLQQENQALNKAARANKDIQDAIKFSRQEYEHFQEDIFHLDIREQNLKKYGIQNISQKMIELWNQKESIIKKISIIDEKIDQQTKSTNKMVHFDIAQRGYDNLNKFKEKREEMQNLKQQNAILTQQTVHLLALKNQYESNPHLEINSLEINLIQAHRKRSSLEKEISTLNRKLSAIIQKIEGLQIKINKSQSASINIVGSNQDEIEIQPKRNKEKHIKRDKSQKCKRPLFNEIKNDLEEKNANINTWKYFISNFWKKDKQNKNIPLNSMYTFKIKNKPQKCLIFIIIILFVAVAWAGHRYHKK